MINRSKPSRFVAASPNVKWSVTDRAAALYWGYDATSTTDRTVGTTAVCMTPQLGVINYKYSYVTFLVFWIFPPRSKLGSLRSLRLRGISPVPSHLSLHKIKPSACGDVLVASAAGSQTRVGDSVDFAGSPHLRSPPPAGASAAARACSGASELEIKYADGCVTRSRR